MTAPTPQSIEDIVIGDALPALAKGPITPSHLVRWAAAMENWHRIHFDWRYATAHDGLPDVGGERLVETARAAAAAHRLGGGAAGCGRSPSSSAG